MTEFEMKNVKILLCAAKSRSLSGRSLFFQIILVAAATNTAFAQKAYARLDSNAMLIGDRMTLHLSIELYDKDLVLTISPDLPLDTATFEIVAAGKWDDRSRSPKLDRNIVFTTFDTGLFTIPKVVFTIKHANGDISRVESPPVLLTVSNPKGVEKMAMPADIKSIVRESATFDDFMPYIIGLVLAAAFGFLAFAFWKKWQNRTLAPTIQTVAQPPHVVAERLLAELKAKQLWQQDKTKIYYSELSYILRGYLESQFRLPALESTTTDFVALLKTTRIAAFDGNEKLILKIRELLETADLVKFAKVEPTTDLNEKLWQYAADIVERTKPRGAEVVDNQADSSIF